MKSVLRLLALFVIASLALVGWTVTAQDAGEIPQITIEKSAEGYTVPAELPEGIVDVTFMASEDVSASVFVARLNEGVTPDALMESLMNEGPMGALALVSIVGGADVPPGQSVQQTLNLQPGNYVVLDLGPEGGEPVTFTVSDADGDGAAAPQADVQVSLFDFAFSVPLQIPADATTWQINNEGEQWHEMGIFRIDDATTLSELRDLLQTIGTAEDPSALPVEPVAFVLPISQGEQLWFDLDLEPGTYVAVCFLPDLVHNTGHAHYEEGMVQIFNVVE